MLEKGELQLDLALVSSILNYADYKSLINYICIQTHKTLIKDEYVCYSDLNNLAFFSEQEWIKAMDKLVIMGLAQKNGSKYITRSKLKIWKEFAHLNTKECFKLNGYILFDVYQLIKQKNNEDLKDLIYLTLHKSVIRGKSISRKFIKLVTGITPLCQKNIEKKHRGTLIEEVVVHHIPVSDSEIKNNKVGTIPVFRGNMLTKTMQCIKTTGYKKSNCNVIQLGNKIKIKELYLTNYKPKNKEFIKLASNLDNINNFSDASVKEVKDWDCCQTVYDLDTNNKTIKSKGIINASDTRYSSTKEIQRWDYEDVYVLNTDGSFNNIRLNLNK